MYRIRLMARLDGPGTAANATTTPVNKFKTRVPDQISSAGRPSGQSGANLRQAYKEPLFYPEERDEVYGARIKFVVHKAEPLDINFSKILDFDLFDNVKRLASSATGAVTTDDRDTQLIEADEQAALDSQANAAAIAAQQAQQAQKEADAAAAKIVKGVSYKRDTTEHIVSMFVPISVTFNDVAQYDNAGLGVVGSGAMGAMQEGSSFLGSAMAGLSQGAASIFGLADNSRFKEEAGRIGAVRAAANPLVPEGVKNAVSIAVQRTLNPNTRALFRGVNIREFTFAFKMIAANPREALTVEKIVTHFRKNVYPETIPNDTEISLAYKFPKAFDISFDYHGKDLRMPKLEKCFLRSVSTNFNPSQAVFHSDGRPVEIDMTLQFVERRTLHRQDVELRGM